MKIAIAHDWLTNMGGAEKVIINFTEIYPNAPIYTTVYNPQKLDESLQKVTVKTTFLQKLKGANKRHQSLLPLMPIAWEQLDFNDFDVVLSSSSSCAKGLVTSPDTMHVCYCHTPMRYAWEFYSEYLEREKIGFLKRKLIPIIMNYIRIWDVTSANRVDYFIANSENVARRIRKHYRRDAIVIHPPVRASYFNTSSIDKDYFLIVSRLVPYKRIDLAVEVFNELGLPLIVIGQGPQFEYLQGIAKDNVKLLGRQSDEVIKEHYAECRAFIFPGEEDFGITPLEAQASGRPVIAYGKGGALETVVEGKTGIFFKNQTKEDLIQAIKEFDKMCFDKNEIRNHALKFDESVFKQKIIDFISEKYNEFHMYNGEG